MMIKACRVQNICFKNFFFLKTSLADCSWNHMPQTLFGFSPIFGRSKGSIKIFRILIQGQLVLQQTLKPGLTSIIWISITTPLIWILQIAS